jgi:hypothetical protein
MTVKKISNIVWLGFIWNLVRESIWLDLPFYYSLFPVCRPWSRPWAGQAGIVPIFHHSDFLFPRAPIEDQTVFIRQGSFIDEL